MENYKDRLNLKHKQTKEIIHLKDKMEDKKNIRKMSFTTYLYKLKNLFLDKEEKAKMKRITVLHEMKTSKK